MVRHATLRWGLVITCAANLLVLTDPARAESSIRQFIKMRWPGGGQLASDGTFYCVDWPDGINQLYRVEAGIAPAPGKKITSFPDGIGGYTLSDDGQWLAMTAAKGGSEQTGLYLMEAGSDTPLALREVADTVYGEPLWRRDSKALAYHANDVSKADFYVYVYDLATRQHKRVLEQPGHFSPADFSDNGLALMVAKFMSASHSQLFEISLTDGSVREVTPEGEWSYESVGYTADEKGFLVVSNYGGDRMQVQRIDLATRAVTPLLTEFADHDVDYARMNEARAILAVAVNEDGYSALHLRSLPELKLIAGPPMAKGVVGNVSFTGEQMLYSLDNANTPGIIYRSRVGTARVDEEAGSRTPLSPPLARGEEPVAMTQADTQGVDVSQFLLPELVKIPSFDGVEVPAFVYVPKGFQKGKPIPFVIQYHGGPEGQYRPSFSRAFQYFLTRGIGVLAPNVRGSSGYGTKFLEMDDYKKRMDSVRDGVESARWLVKNGYSEPKKIAAWGGSYGGFMVMATITEAPELFGAAANVVGIVNFETFLTLTKDYRRKLREAEYGPLTDTEFLKSISPIYKIDRIQTPLLIAHGLNDPRVPVNEALQLAVGLMKLGRPVEQIIFPDEGHGFAKEENRLLYYEKLAEFFERHLLTAERGIRSAG